MNARYRPAALGMLLLVSALAIPLRAHDFWIEPSPFEPAVNSAVRVFLRVGQSFAGDPMPRLSNAIEAFFVVGPKGRQEMPGRDGMDPAGLFRVTDPGTMLVGYRSRTSPVTLDAAAFEKYLHEEGLERIIETRAKRGQSAAPGVEVFSRSVKALLRAGDAEPIGHDRILGLTLELVPERHPAALPPDGRMPVRLLYNGAALEGALVKAISQDRKTSCEARTDRDGRVVLPLDNGVWMIKAVHMIPAPAGSGADWESIWASLTFKATKSSAALPAGTR